MSDADTQVAQAMAAEADPWPEAATIDTGGPLDKSLDQALAIIHPHGVGPLWHCRPRISPD